MWFHTGSHPYKTKNPILNAMKLVFASDSFKGTLTSARIGELLEQAARLEEVAGKGRKA